MTHKTTFWTIGYTLPVAVALAFSIQLQREHAALEAAVAKLTASSLQIELALQESTAQWQKLEHECDSIEAGLKKLKKNLSPWQRWNLAVMQAAARLAAQGRSKAKGSIPLLDRSSYIPQLLDDPVYHAAVAALAKQQVEAKYGRLFSALNLSPADQDELEDLLAQKEMAWADAKALVLNGSADASASSPEVQADAKAASADTMRAIYAEIRAEFGPDVSQSVSAYEGIAQFYNFTDEFTASLSNTTAPLQSGQADELVALLAQALGSKVYTSYWEIPDSVVEEAKAFLSPAQIDILEQLKQYQNSRLSALHL